MIAFNSHNLTNVASDKSRKENNFRNQATSYRNSSGLKQFTVISASWYSLLYNPLSLNVD